MQPVRTVLLLLLLLLTLTRCINSPQYAFTPDRYQSTSRQDQPTPSQSLSISSSPSPTEEILLVQVGGVYTMPVEINGVLTLNFILDSGASEVNIPADVVLTLVRAGTIKDTDFLSGKTYVLADGSELKSPRFIIRSLKIGRQQITNVPASVGSLTSPLLLGQSLLGRLGTWGIDNQRKVLIINSDTSTASSGETITAPMYQRALRLYQGGNHEVAIVLFKQFIRQNYQSPLAGEAQYWIGESLYSLKQFQAAIVAFDEVVQKHPQSDKIPSALLKIGYAFVELQDLRNARFFLRQVRKRYPKTPESQQALVKLRELR